MALSQSKGPVGAVLVMLALVTAAGVAVVLKDEPSTSSSMRTTAEVAPLPSQTATACGFDPMLPQTAAADGQLRLMSDLAGKTAAEANALMALGRQVAQQERARDAEVAFIMACRLAGHLDGHASARVADAKLELGQHYTALVTGKKLKGLGEGTRSDVLRRAQAVLSESRLALEVQRGPMDSRTRMAAEATAVARQALAGGSSQPAPAAPGQQPAVAGDTVAAAPAATSSLPVAPAAVTSPAVAAMGAPAAAAAPQAKVAAAEPAPAGPAAPAPALPPEARIAQAPAASAIPPLRRTHPQRPTQEVDEDKHEDVHASSPPASASRPAARKALPPPARAIAPPGVARDAATPATTVRPSFNCAKARSVPERLICSDPELARLDRELGGLHAQAKRAAPDTAAFNRRNNQEWKRREVNCRDRLCLLAWYGERRQQLVAEIRRAETRTTASTTRAAEPYAGGPKN